MARRTRRNFLTTGMLALPLVARWPAPALGAKTTQPEPQGFYTVDRRDGRWWFVAPDGQRVFSLGLNHIDPSSLRYPDTGHIWRDRYGNSMQRWLKEAVATDLKKWGFNCVGWTQEVVTRGEKNHRHSRPLTFEEYQWLDMPYCHLLPFADFHQWEVETRHPDFFSKDFADWCDHVAREHCAPLSNDPKLIGYFYVDCPTWVHTRTGNAWKGPLFDPKKLDTPDGRRDLFELATQYYKVSHDAIRRYDRHHLILGDRYEARAALPVDVVQAARPYVDVLCFQHFGKPDQIARDFNDWYRAVEMPILLADGSGSIAGPDGSRRQDGRQYRQTLQQLRTVPGCVGFHLCGAYLRNRVRRKGLRDQQERPDTEGISWISQANQETAQWTRQFSRNR